jgi:hypothetical protein
VLFSSIGDIEDCGVSINVVVVGVVVGVVVVVRMVTVVSSTIGDGIKTTYKMMRDEENQPSIPMTQRRAVVHFISDLASLNWQLHIPK